MKARIGAARLLLPAVLLGLAACSSGGGEGDKTFAEHDQGQLPGGYATVTLEGQAADGYLVGARVFLDRNMNRRPDPGEPLVETGAEGRFSLVVPQGDEKIYPLVVQVDAGRTVDEDTGRPVAKDFILEAPIGRHSFVSPLTTLVKREMDKNPSWSLEEAEVRVRTALDIQNTSLFSDYLQQPASPAQAKESAEVHKRAVIVAGLMGELQEEIGRNWGGEIPSDFTAAAMAAISDLVMGKGSSIAKAVRSGGSQFKAEEILSELLKEMPVETMTQSRLKVYRERLQEANPVWDVTPPSITARTPGPNQTAPIDTTISVSFDELLKTTGIRPETLKVLQGKNAVPGRVFYDETNLRLDFEPDNPLSAFSKYTVILLGEVGDHLGNTFGQDVSWTFTTIFDLTPPSPPNL